MSTNFYFTPMVNTALSVFGVLHIGKRSGGWRFSFRGYRHTGGSVWADLGCGLSVKVETPPLQITSLKDWLEVFKDGVITSEYGTPYTVNEFLAAIDLEGQSHAKTYPRDDSWSDEQGNSFGNYEFC